MTQVPLGSFSDWACNLIEVLNNTLAVCIVFRKKFIRKQKKCETFNNFVSKFCQIWLSDWTLVSDCFPLKLGFLLVQIIGPPQKVHCGL